MSLGQGVGKANGMDVREELDIDVVFAHAVEGRSSLKLSSCAHHEFRKEDNRESETRGNLPTNTEEKNRELEHYTTKRKVDSFMMAGGGVGSFKLPPGKVKHGSACTRRHRLRGLEDDVFGSVKRPSSRVLATTDARAKLRFKTVHVGINNLGSSQKKSGDVCHKTEGDG